MKNLTKSVAAVICGLGLSMFAMSANAEQTTTTAPAAQANMQLAGWWWNDCDYGRCSRYYRDDRAYRFERWCARNPRKCSNVRARYRANTWCRNHPNRCYTYRW